LNSKSLFIGTSSIIAATTYIFYIYYIVSDVFLFKHSIVIALLCSCFFSIFLYCARFFSSQIVREFVVATVQMVLVIAGAFFTDTYLTSTGIPHLALRHCAAICPLGLALLAAQVNSTFSRPHHEAFISISLILSAVIPLLIIPTVFVYIYKNWSGPQNAPYSLPFMTKPDPLGALVCNLFFTLSLSYGLFLSSAHIYRLGLAYGISAPVFFEAYFIIPFAIAIAALFKVNKVVTLKGFIFYLAVAPSAIIPGYFILPLSYLVILASKRQPIPSFVSQSERA